MLQFFIVLTVLGLAFSKRTPLLFRMSAILWGVYTYKQGLWQFEEITYHWLLQVGVGVLVGLGIFCLSFIATTEHPLSEAKFCMGSIKKVLGQHVMKEISVVAIVTALFEEAVWRGVVRTTQIEEWGKPESTSDKIRRISANSLLFTLVSSW